MSEKGRKFDGDKPDYSLMPPYAEDELAKLLTFGGKKYAPNNWQKVKPKSRYYSAIRRHLTAYMKAVLSGNKKAQYDDESGIHHLICVACNAFFLYEHEVVYSKDESFYGERKEEEKSVLPKIDPSTIDKNKLDEVTKEITRRRLEKELFPNKSPELDRFSPFQPPYIPGDFPKYVGPGEPDYYTVWCGTPIECLTAKQASDIIDLK